MTGLSRTGLSKDLMSRGTPGKVLTLDLEERLLRPWYDGLTSDFSSETVSLVENCSRLVPGRVYFESEGFAKV